ncbi:MAG: hypothetical protein AB7F89_26380 [Pirellulaceae bacterium]
MSDVKALAGRLDAEFNSFHQATKQLQQTAQKEYEARESRFRTLYVPAAARVVEIVKPRLALLVERFQDRVDVSPVVTEHTREITLKFNSPLARVNLLFRMGHDAEVKNLVLEQSLEILPILMEYDSHSSLTLPLEKVEDDKIVNWLDDRLVKFVQTVAAMHRNQFYLKDHLVMDPIAGVQMPKFAAKATIQSGGRTHYFISDETKREFEERQKGAAKK